MSKPNFLILGGCGFIGRCLVKFLVENDLAGFIRAADKAMPATANMTPEYEALYDKPNVEYKQCNLSNPASVAKVFAEDKGAWNFVINLAAETKYGQPEAAYKERTLDLAVKCAEEALKHKIDKYIEVSTYQVYEPGKKPRAEDGKVKPWTTNAKFSLEKEQAVQQLAAKGLPLIIVRPALVYGPCDSANLAPRLIAGATYTLLNEQMKFLWSSDLKIPTVHVRDVVKALHFLCLNGERGKVYNIADKNDTDQGKINKILEALFGIKTGFQNAVMNGLAKVNFAYTAEVVNDKHLQPWMELCKQHGIKDTPLTPFIDGEVLKDNNLMVDGSAIEKLGFKYDHPVVTPDLVREQIAHFVAVKQFPPITK